jgi:hypothetical protein
MHVCLHHVFLVGVSRWVYQSYHTLLTLQSQEPRVSVEPPDSLAKLGQLAILDSLVQQVRITTSFVVHSCVGILCGVVVMTLRQLTAGFTGSTGDTGATGTTGYTGATGFTGATGDNIWLDVL